MYVIYRILTYIYIYLYISSSRYSGPRHRAQDSRSYRKSVRDRRFIYHVRSCGKHARSCGNLFLLSVYVCSGSSSQTRLRASCSIFPVCLHRVASELSIPVETLNSHDIFDEEFTLCSIGQSLWKRFTWRFCWRRGGYTEFWCSSPANCWKLKSADRCMLVYDT